MKKHVTLPPIFSMLFGLSLVALLACYQPFLSANQTSAGHDISGFTEFLETRRHHDDTSDEFCALAYPHSHASVWIAGCPSLSSSRVLDNANKPFLPNTTLPQLPRRVEIQSWVRTAMTDTLLPTPIYQLMHDQHRLQGWKDANLQYRTLTERAFHHTYA